ncbi:hypothetical protein NQZ68_027566 [Dissostichus eleginoides]|nr:hypothetical protein NQZ68_027566 [Dissostichus eleginoides]
MVEKVIQSQQRTTSSACDSSWGGGGMVAKDTADLHDEQGKFPEESPLCFCGGLSCQRSVIETAELTTWITLLTEEAVFLCLLLVYTQMVSLLPPQLPSSQCDLSPQIMLSLQQFSAVLDTLPAL